MSILFIPKIFVSNESLLSAFPCIIKHQYYRIFKVEILGGDRGIHPCI